MEDDNSSQMAASASSASLGTLPEEVILHIFAFLPPEDLMFGVRATCRYFYDLSRNVGLWEQVTLTNIMNLEPGRSRCCMEPFYRKLLEQECISSNGSDIMPVRQLIKSVEEQGDVWPSCSVTGTMHYPNLERLTLLKVTENLPSLEVLVNHQRLRHLELRTSLFLDDDNKQNSQGQLVIGLFQNLKGLTNLQTLVFCFKCSQHTDNRSSISDIQASMKDYFLTGPGLRQIELMCFVNDVIFKAILENCTQLSGLAMSCPELTPEAFCAAVSGKHKLSLSALRIDFCETLNDACLRALSVAFPEIKSLQLSLTEKITNDGLGLFLEACPQLTDLKLTTFHGHKLLGGKTSKNLKSLAMYSITFRSALAFRKLYQHCQNLREIELISSNIGNADMIVMANSCCLLEKVSLRDCSHVDSTGVVYLMKNLPRLQTCTGFLSKPHLFQLEQLSPSRKRTRAGGLVLENQAGPTEGGLCSLELAHCQELTPVGVSALAILCPNLRELVIHAPSSVNDHIVRAILRNLPNLQCLVLNSSESSKQKQLTGACLRHIQRWGTRLQRLRLITHYRSFSIAALGKLLAQSSTLVECGVPRHTEQGPDITSSEVARIVNEQYLQLQRQGKLCVAKWSLIVAVSGYVLTLRVSGH